jgi:hypothetical protein
MPYETQPLERFSKNSQASILIHEDASINAVHEYDPVANATSNQTPEWSGIPKIWLQKPDHGDQTIV